MKTSKVKPPQKRSSSHMAAASRGGKTLVPRFVTCRRENVTRIANAAFYGINFWTLLLDCQKCYWFLQGLARCKGHKSPVLYLYFCWPGHVSSQVSGIGIGDKLFRYGDFFLKKIIVGPRKLKFRHLWLRWSWPNVLAYQNFWSTIWHPLVAKFSNTCHFWHFLRVRWKRSPQSTGLPWEI